MYFQQFYLTCLSHASYMIGSDGVAAVVDPQRDVALYIEEAALQGFAIEHIIETHLHADFVSGHRELADLTGAKIYLGAKAGATFPHVPVVDGDEIHFGTCVLRFLETPGHTIESVTVLVTDIEKSPEPFAALTGDALFIGDVGRPDLSGDLTPQQLAGMLYDSLHTKLMTLPDGVEVYPAHGAGSLCGRQMRPERVSTIGKERATNYALRAASKDDFIQLLTSELPERPAYFAKDAEINRTGAGALTELAPLAELTPAELMEKQTSGATVLDTRPPQQFGAGHVPGAVHIALAGQFASWAGTVLGLDREIVLVAEDPEQASESRMRLARVGVENVTGWLAGGMDAWLREDRPTQSVPQISADDLSKSLDDFQIVDVRRQPEYDGGHIAGAHLMPLHKITTMLDGLDKSKPIAVHCKGGYRSSIGTSLLQKAGFTDVWNVMGGYDAWATLGLPIESSGPPLACGVAAPLSA
ncbi:MAG: rhodanese-like domain-containing protein [Bryobacteraceae bacterium]